MKNKGKRVATYARFSSHNQNENSISAQQRAMKKYIEDNDYFLVESYSDEAMTGTNTNRPNLQKMRMSASNGNFDILLVHKLDRLSRDVVDALNIQQELYRYNIKIESVIENYDDTPEGEMFKNFQLIINQYYSSNLGREVMKGLKENDHQCKHNGGIPPLGYKVNPETKQYEIDEQEAIAVQIIFTKFLEGYTYQELADYLNLMGFRTKKGGKFVNKSSFYEILNNRKYIGEFIYNRTERRSKHTKRSHRKSKDESEIVRIKGGMPALIDESMFEEVQRRFKERKRTKGNLKAKTTYLLTGRIVCDQCGSPYHGNSRKGGRNSVMYYSYRCSRRKALHPDKKCPCKEINRDWIDQFIIKQLFDCVLNPVNKEKFIQAVQAEMAKKTTMEQLELPEKKKRLRTIENQLESLVDILAKQDISSMETLIKKIQELEEQKKILKEEVQQMEQARQAVIIDENWIESTLNEARQKINTKNDISLKQVITEFIKEVRINDETVKIIYNLNSLFGLEKNGFFTWLEEYKRSEFEQRAYNIAELLC